MNLQMTEEAGETTLEDSKELNEKKLSPSDVDNKEYAKLIDQLQNVVEKSNACRSGILNIGCFSVRVPIRVMSYFEQSLRGLTKHTYYAVKKEVDRDILYMRKIQAILEIELGNELKEKVNE